jgi:hypothetical protein
MGVDNSNFLGKGWGFPPAFARGPNSVRIVEKEEDIRQSLEILLSTSLGERFLHPDYGCDFHDFLFDSFDESMKRYFEDLIETAILLHEPRIKPDKIEMNFKPMKALIIFNIYYWIKTTNSRSNYVYPFHLKEGTDIE